MSRSEYTDNLSLQARIAQLPPEAWMKPGKGHKPAPRGLLSRLLSVVGL